MSQRVVLSTDFVTAVEFRRVAQKKDLCHNNMLPSTRRCVEVDLPTVACIRCG